MRVPHNPSQKVGNIQFRRTASHKRPVVMSPPIKPSGTTASSLEEKECQNCPNGRKNSTGHSHGSPHVVNGHDITRHTDRAADDRCKGNKFAAFVLKAFRHSLDFPAHHCKSPPRLRRKSHEQTYSQTGQHNCLFCRNKRVLARAIPRITVSSARVTCKIP